MGSEHYLIQRTQSWITCQTSILEPQLFIATCITNEEDELDDVHSWRHFRCCGENIKLIDVERTAEELYPDITSGIIEASEVAMPKTKPNIIHKNNTVTYLPRRPGRLPGKQVSGRPEPTTPRGRQQRQKLQENHISNNVRLQQGIWSVNARWPATSTSGNWASLETLISTGLQTFNWAYQYHPNPSWIKPLWNKTS